MKPTTSPLEELQLEMARHMVREAATKADMAEVQLKESLVRLEATKSLAEMAKIELRILKRSE